MKKLKNYVILGTTIAALPMLTGCGTIYAYQHNKRNAIEERVYNSGDPEIVKAYRNGDVHGIGFEVSAIDTIFRSPQSFGIQLLGALADVAAFFGIQEFADSVNDDSSDSSSTSAGRDATVINNTGDGNTVEINNSQGSSIAPTEPAI